MTNVRRSYLVTGAAGFIGARVCELLLERGHSVRGLDNLNDYYNPLLKRKRLEKLLEWPDFAFIQVDIEDRAALDRLAREHGPFDAVIHLAARAGVRSSVENPCSYMQTNLVGTLNVVDLCRNFSVPKLISASSSSVYGSISPTPFRESSDTDHPLSPYAASKKAAEGICFTYHHLYSLDASVLRFFTVYGPAGRPDMSVFRFVRSIVEGEPITVYGDGSQLRDFSYVDDIARGVIASLRPCGFKVFNLGADHPVRLMELIQLIERLAGRKAVMRYETADPSDVPATWADVDRARSELDWNPAVTLDQGIGCALEWYLSNRDWVRQV